MRDQGGNRKTTRGWKFDKIVAVAAMAALMAGCASTKIEKTRKAPSDMPQPDFILVKNLAVDPAAVRKDKSMAALLNDGVKDAKPNEVERKIGEKVAKAFTDRLVKDLNDLGIKAFKYDGKKRPTDKTLVIKGTFLRIDQGNRVARVLIGFGIGGERVDAKLGAWQNGEQVAMGTLRAKASKKPGIAVPIGVGAAAGTVITSSAVSGGSAVVSEYMTAVEGRAAKAADKVASTIAKAYVERGWLPKENLSLMDRLFD